MGGIQLPLGVLDVVGEYQRLKRERLELTAKERHQKETVDSLAAMLRRERKLLRELQARKASAEDAEEAHRAAHDLEV